MSMKSFHFLTPQKYSQSTFIVNKKYIFSEIRIQNYKTIACYLKKKIDTEQ